MRRIKNAIDRFVARQTSELNELSVARTEGQALVEYAIIIGLIAVVCVIVVGVLGSQVSDQFASIVSNL